MAQNRVCASIVEEGRAAGRFQFQCGFKDRTDFLPLFRGHAADFPRFISRSSQERAEDQLRLTVAVETPRNCEVSSIESPPKYLSSIIWLCWESSLASLLRASSSARRSTVLSGRQAGEAMAGSRVSRIAPDPRLEARRFRS